MKYLNGQHDYGGTEQQHGNPCDWRLHRLDRFRGQFVFHMLRVLCGSCRNEYKVCELDHYLNLLSTSKAAVLINVLNKHTAEVAKAEKRP